MLKYILIATLSLTSIAETTTSTKLELKTLEKNLKSSTVEIKDALSSSAKNANVLNVEGYKLAEVLNFVFKNEAAWKNSKKIIFECADGYKAAIPTENVIKYDGYLAYKFSNNQKFELNNNTQGGKIVKLSPLYLVWKSDEMTATSKAHFWPYQVVGLSLK